jgi:uncharacterized membrane protein YidH (DUF202 family)
VIATKGLLHLTIGVLAAMAALGDTDGATPDTAGVLTEAAGRPFGFVLLVVLGVGTAGYGLWRFTQALFDTERLGREPRAIARRFAYAASGTVYLGLSYLTVDLLRGARKDETGDEAARDLSATVLAWPFGRALVIAVGAVLAGVAIMQMWRAYKQPFREDFESCDMDRRFLRVATAVSRFGLFADGVVFGIAAWFVTKSAIRFDPEEARGLGGALHALLERPYGSPLLLVVAIGVAAFGVYCLIRARYRLLGAPA